MSWFSDTVIYQSVNHVEVRVIAGTFIVLVAIAISYMCMRAHNKFMSAKIRQTAQSEIQLNNVRSQ